jgi:soluble lytic murein transglycosylase
MKTKTTFTLLALASVAIVPIMIMLPGRDLSDVARQPASNPANPLSQPKDVAISRPSATGQIAPPIAPLPIPTPNLPVTIPNSPLPAELSELKRGMDRLTSRDVAGAIALRDRLGRDSIDGSILSWAIALSGQSSVTANELVQTLATIGNFPGRGTIRGHYERALVREQASPETLIAALSANAPSTLEGKLGLAQALQTTGRTADAAQIIRSIWHEEALDSARETQVTQLFPDVLTEDDHRKRFFMLAYRGRLADAKRFTTLAKTQSLHSAWLAVVNQAKDATKLIAAAKLDWSAHPALLYIEVRQKRMSWDYADAARLLEGISNEQIEETSPSAWWNEMRIVARGLLDQGNYRRAYELVAAHPTLESTEAVDAEFHAGWLALRYLKDPQLAAPHFRKMLGSATTSIALSKAHYWLGRSHQQSDPDIAKNHFKTAAAHGASFYGQLASDQLGQNAPPVELPTITDDDRIFLAGRPMMHAIERLEGAGYGWRAEILYRTLAGEIDRPGELALLTSRLEARGAHQVSLQVGKAAFSRGVEQTALAFPISAIPPSAEIGDTGKALAFAIARQESAFDVGAISPANAQGLLQILPGTAKEVAGRMKLEFNPTRLTTDAAYNATLGAQYLAEQISKFNGSYVLTFIAYNAGPRRVDEWIERYGDPREMPLEAVIDWIERIPFPETRNYVQRVMENYQVYKARFGQKTDIASDLTTGRL